MYGATKGEGPFLDHRNRHRTDGLGPSDAKLTVVTKQMPPKFLATALLQYRTYCCLELTLPSPGILIFTFSGSFIVANPSRYNERYNAVEPRSSVKGAVTIFVSGSSRYF